MNNGSYTQNEGAKWFLTWLGINWASYCLFDGWWDREIDCLYCDCRDWQFARLGVVVAGCVGALGIFYIEGDSTERQNNSHRFQGSSSTSMVESVDHFDTFRHESTMFAGYVHWLRTLFYLSRWLVISRSLHTGSSARTQAVEVDITTTERWGEQSSTFRKFRRRASRGVFPTAISSRFCFSFLCFSSGWN